MVLSNSEKQARWRERHIAKRRNAQRIVSLLLRRDLTDEHIEQVANLLNSFLNPEGVRILRRRLREITEFRPDNPPPRRWSAEDIATLELLPTEREAWERDHPGEEYPEHECGLSDREYTDLNRWRRQRARKHTRQRERAR
jgi:hypothetical protein